MYDLILEAGGVNISTEKFRVDISKVYFKNAMEQRVEEFTLIVDNHEKL